MIITLRDELLRSKQRYSGIRPRYIPYESVYSILSRFGLFNVVAGGALIEIIKQHCNPQISGNRHCRHLAYVESLGVTGLQGLFGLSLTQAKSLFLSPTFIDPERHVASELRYCPICLSQGRHYTLFQYQLIEACPVHSVDLLNHCPHCAALVSYKFNAALFKHPYGCWRCGRQLGCGRDPQSLRFISAHGMQRLRQFHRMLGGENKHLVFDIVGPADLHCDNVLQLSHSVQQFTRVEADLFSNLQVMACDHSFQSALRQYPTFSRFSRANQEEVGVESEILINELVSISKSIFRNIKKNHLAEIRLTDKSLELLWRDVQGVLLPANYYTVLAYIDWLCYWRQAKVPCELLRSAHSSRVKMAAWIAEKKRHSLFRQTSPEAERWLLRQMLGCEVVTLLKRQMEQRQLLTQGVDAPDCTDVPYRRILHPVCWAVVFSEQSGRPPSMTFISAHSWNTDRNESHSGLPSAEARSLHGQSLQKVFRLINA
ncbi:MULTISPECIES: TniQ family protein [Pseudomonadaceae]|jgi:hypothetical protein|uniref:TniQ domain-containing protein n=2 Tax=Ectopseudomonas TaxID=3236654 RepID=A0A379IUX1_ECTME|nr:MULTISPECIES: TniQ family protein [Pseudomonas]AEB58511.1 hypothetical protein MDS_2480 [Pseudomonas mendocina NK-01]MDU9408011.1 TniQ family protein [Pseudomonas sp. zfem001]WAJ35442.1 TniQ family protein [Pseudomonas sp. GOM7]SFO92167.1 TniQ protein [Pseudomonas composti]SUD40107.1 Uncharacterised protein [Pseudomonas mendocina]